MSKDGDSPSSRPPANLQPDGDGPSEAEFIRRVEQELKPQLKNPDAAPKIAISLVQQSQHFSGPLPPPLILKGYEDTAPGAASIIIDMARSEQRHRHWIDLLQTIYPFCGLFVGAVALGLCIAGAVYLALHDRPVIAGALLAAPVLAAVGWMINGRITKEPEPPPATGRRSTRTRRGR